MRRYRIPAEELEFDFIRSSGPGGQNVNKVSTAMQLRFDVGRSPSLPDDAKERLKRLAGRRLTDEGVLIISARSQRTQEQNRAEAVARLEALVEQAASPPRPRHRTRPTASQRAARVEDKKRRGAVKRTRRFSGGNAE